eukprot:87198-Pelagomonas_calceolata.AAC.3
MEDVSACYWHSCGVQAYRHKEEVGMSCAAPPSKGITLTTKLALKPVERGNTLLTSLKSLCQPHSPRVPRASIADGLRVPDPWQHLARSDL